jgi:hypothetical protein
MARDFSSPRFTRAGCFTTTQVPHFGQVTHEHTMRSAISGLYCSGIDPILAAIGSAEDHRLASFATVRRRGGELADMLPVSGQDEARAVIAVGCLQLLCALNPVQDTKFCPFDGFHSPDFCGNSPPGRGKPTARKAIGGRALFPRLAS